MSFSFRQELGIEEQPEKRESSEKTEHYCISPLPMLEDRVGGDLSLFFFFLKKKEGDQRVTQGKREILEQDKILKKG